MKNTILSLALCAVLAPAVLADEDKLFRSPFGFELRVPADWTRSATDDMVLFRAPWEDGNQPTLAVYVVAEGTVKADSIEKSVAGMAATLKNEKDIEFIESGKVDLGGKPGHALRYKIKSGSRIVWQVVLAPRDTTVIVLTFGSLDALYGDRKAMFEKIAKSLAPTDVRKASASHRLHRHPIGISFEVPADWTEEKVGNKVYFAQPGHEGDRYPLVLAVTAPIPEEVDTLEEIEEYITRDLDENKLAADIATDSYLGEIPSKVVTWTVKARKEVVRQTGAIWEEALVVVTGTCPTSELSQFEPIFDHLEETWRFDE